MIVSCRERKIAATCAIAGSVLLFIGTSLHPLGANPNDAGAAFAEYAADQLWRTSHLAQLAGVGLIMVALLSLAEQLKAGDSAGWARIAGGGTIASLTLAGALQAVDGIALKATVDA